MTASSGNRVLLEGDDNPHGEQMYVAADCAEIFAAAFARVTFTATPAAVALGNTAATGTDLAASFTAVGVTVDLAAGSFTVDKPGLYQLYFCGRITGEEDEDVTLEWAKGGTVLAAPHQFIKVIDGTLFNALIDECSFQSTVLLAKGDVITLTVLGSASEVVDFTGFNFGIRFITSTNYDVI